MTQEFTAYVDSADEQLAYLLSRFGPQNQWRVIEQRIVNHPNGDVAERATLHTAEGKVRVEFRDAHPFGGFAEPEDERDLAVSMERMMEVGSRFAANNPPHHPGSIPRFPVPIEHYPGAVGIPLPILAVDEGGRRGLFAPPRMVVVSWHDAEPVGVREFDGFDPANWPPRRLGDWPVPSAALLETEVLQACIQRFSASWSRLIGPWLGAGSAELPQDRVLVSDARDALRLRALLDLPAMDEVYRVMNPRFDRWVRSLR